MSSHNAIVVVAYNRPKCVTRILSSLNEAIYDENVDLIISIDYSDIQPEIVKIARDFEWKFGNKIIRDFKERQGLRPHVLQCGDLTNDYDAVIVLEDDITVSKGFYSYVKQALKFYDSDQRIAGISLYSFAVNPGNGRPFEPQKDAHDCFIMQMAQSWGQCWSRRMWHEFRTWYNANSGKIPNDGVMPEYIVKWNDKSWMKYYDRFIALNDKYFIYPYVSLSTNNSDVGEHCKDSNNDYQVQLLDGILSDYRFPTFDKAIKYDMYFDRLDIDFKSILSLDAKCILDLYGLKNNYSNGRYLISVQRLPFKVVDSFRLCTRPIEMNVIMPSKGTDIFLYDLLYKGTKPSDNSLQIARFDVKAEHWKLTRRHGLNGFLNAVKSRIIKK